MINDQYNKNSTSDESYVSENYHGQMLENGFMDNFYSNETEQNTPDTSSNEANIPQGIIIAHMPDLGDCKPILNGNNETGYRRSANITPQHQHHGLLGSLNNFICGSLGLMTNRSDDNTNNFPSTSETRQFGRTNIRFSRLVAVGVVVLFCGVGLVVQNQMSKSDDSKKVEGQIVAIENDSNTAAKIDDTTGNKLNPNNEVAPQNLDTTKVANAQNKNPLPIKTQNKNDKNLTANNPNTPNTHKKDPAVNPNSNPNSQSDQNTTKQSLWDRQSTDNYSPWMKSGQILLETETQPEINPNTNTHSTEHQNNIITQTSTTQLQPSRISTPYPSAANPNRQPAQQPATPLKNNPQNESYHYSNNHNYNYNNYGNTPNTERVAPPPYANSMSLPIPNSFHSPPPSAGYSQGRIAAAETPATYRKFYNNPADSRIVHNSTQPPVYNYPTQPAGTVVPPQPPLTASAYPTNHYQNQTYQPTPTYQPTIPYTSTTYHNTNYPTPTYTNPNTTYPTTTYPNTPYPNPNYPSGTTYPTGVYVNPAYTPANQPIRTNQPY
ncbi:MAG: hypothetical protein LBK06_06585 [Planctomycetaceae bacterium]|jgi:hypothetical protein|nr:hypothetical protein [Planctomycetaceae bacterium]